MRGFMGLCALVMLAGCPKGTESDTGEPPDTDPVATLGLTAALTATGATLTITNGDAGNWFFGLSQSGTSDNWTGEDCNTGYTLGTGEVLQYCHPSSNTGVTLTLGTLAEVEADATKTLFSSGLNGTTAFYAEDPAGGCYVDNDGAGQYTALGCAAFP